MRAGYPLPEPEDVRELLVALLAREVLVDLGASAELHEGSAAAVGVYVTDREHVASLVLVDGPLACRAGAALSMLPAAVADESIGEGGVPANLLDNTGEVLNVLARLLNSERTAHVRLRAVRPLPADLGHEAAALLASPADRRSFTVDIDGYGPGTATVLVA